MSEQRFTVFFRTGYQDNSADQEEFSGLELQPLIDLCAKSWPDNRLVAWAAGEWFSTHASRAESIAAGRLIVKEGDRYIAVIPKDEPLFRVGGIYRNHLNALVRILDVDERGCARMTIPEEGGRLPPRNDHQHQHWRAVRRPPRIWPSTHPLTHTFQGWPSQTSEQSGGKRAQRPGSWLCRNGESPPLRSYPWPSSSR